MLGILSGGGVVCLGMAAANHFAPFPWLAVAIPLTLTLTIPFVARRRKDRGAPVG